MKKHFLLIIVSSMVTASAACSGKTDFNVSSSKKEASLGDPQPASDSEASAPDENAKPAEQGDDTAIVQSSAPANVMGSYLTLSCEYDEKQSVSRAAFLVCSYFDENKSPVKRNIKVGDVVFTYVNGEKKKTDAIDIPKAQGHFGVFVPEDDVASVKTIFAYPAKDADPTLQDLPKAEFSFESASKRITEMRSTLSAKSLVASKGVVPTAKPTVTVDTVPTTFPSPEPTVEPTVLPTVLPSQPPPENWFNVVDMCIDIEGGCGEFGGPFSATNATVVKGESRSVSGSPIKRAQVKVRMRREDGHPPITGVRLCLGTKGGSSGCTSTATAAQSSLRFEGPDVKKLSGDLTDVFYWVEAESNQEAQPLSGVTAAISAEGVTASLSQLATIHLGWLASGFTGGVTNTGGLANLKLFLQVQ